MLLQFKLNDRTQILVVQPESTVEEVKLQVSATFQIPVENVRIVSAAGKVFNPDHAEISSLKLKENDLVYVTRTSGSAVSPQNVVPNPATISAQNNANPLFPPEMSRMMDNPLMEYN